MSSDLSTSKKGFNLKVFFKEQVLPLGGAILLVFAIRSSVIEAFKIPSGSMYPTLYIGDHIFVNKFAYGIKLPFSDLVSNTPVYLYHRDPPKRGDIVVFNYPKNPSIYFIKRLIGTPGDVVEVKNKVIYINDKMQERTQIKGEEFTKVKDAMDEAMLFGDGHYNSEKLELYKENLDGVEHEVLNDPESFDYDLINWGPRTIPEGHFFAMGDNRDMSNDGRKWGFIPFEYIKGKAVVIWLSMAVNFTEKNFKVRPGRTGTLLR